MHAAILGNLSDGFTVHGPFETIEAAFDYADHHADEQSWCVTMVAVPPPTLVDEKHSPLHATLQRVYELATVAAFTEEDKDYVADFHDFVVNCPWLEPEPEED
jgi:hypothetical protein